MITREWPLAPAPSWARRFGDVLLAGSRALAALASRLGHVETGDARGVPQLEFHAEAGAPEGALYVDGKLVGHLPGVRRL
jgi:hypothetical protein